MIEIEKKKNLQCHHRVAKNQIIRLVLACVIADDAWQKKWSWRVTEYEISRCKKIEIDELVGLQSDFSFHSFYFRSGIETQTISLYFFPHCWMASYFLFPTFKSLLFVVTIRIFLKVYTSARYREVTRPSRATIKHNFNTIEVDLSMKKIDIGWTIFKIWMSSDSRNFQNSLSTSWTNPHTQIQIINISNSSSSAALIFSPTPEYYVHMYNVNSKEKTNCLILSSAHIFRLFTVS